MIDRGQLVVDTAISELHSLVESMWAYRDSHADEISLEQMMTYQNEADMALAHWAWREGVPVSTPEERADALIRLREDLATHWEEVLTHG